MIKQIFYILIAFVFFSLNSNAQSITTSVLSTGGGSANAGGAQLSWTVGQPFSPGALTAGGSILTLGFQQPELQVWTGFVNNMLYPGNQVTIPFAASGIISQNNKYTAELSDKNGSFSRPLMLGTLTGNQNGTIVGNVPSNAVAGNEYRIRVRSSESPFDGMDNGYALTIKQKFTVNAYPNPSKTHFGLQTEGTTGESILITVYDVFGRTVQILDGMFAKGIINIGQTYSPGIYITEIKQGNQIVTLQLIKLSN